MNNPILTPIWNWLREAVNRFRGKTPKFNTVFTYIGLAAVLIGFIPDILTELNIDIPAKWDATAERILKIAGIVVAVMSRIGYSNPLIGITEKGQIIKTTDAKKLPFTAHNEEKKAAKLHVQKIESSAIDVLSKPYN